MANQRNYLIYEDVEKNAELKPYFEGCVNRISNGTARNAKTRAERGFPQHDCFRYEGKEALRSAVMEYYLRTRIVPGFDYGKAIDFCERFRTLTGFSFDFRYPLEQWVYCCLRAPYFYNRDESGDSWNEDWVINPDAAHDFIADDFFRLACYIALCHMKYGASYESVTANHIFDIVTALGSDIPAKLKKDGSRTLPKDVTEYKDAEVSCKANDAFATIKIAIKTEREENYAKVLDFLCRLLEADFPGSYAIDFRSPDKNYLPVRDLPKKGINQLFANAVRYPALHGDIGRYARLAMNEFDWYTNLENEDSAMPGSFAVFALSLADPQYTPLLCDYLDLCDDEHSGIQGKFLPAYIEKYGFIAETVKVFLAGAGSMQELPHNKIYAAAIANGESLRLFSEAKRECDKYVWRAALFALWGKDAARENGRQTIKKAPAELKPLYERIFS
jgi:hypothetical protein